MKTVLSYLLLFGVSVGLLAGVGTIAMRFDDPYMAGGILGFYLAQQHEVARAVWAALLKVVGWEVP